MIRLINKLTGSVMWVDPARKAEYLAAGHRLAAGPEAAPEAISKTKTEAKPKTARPAKKRAAARK